MLHANTAGAPNWVDLNTSDVEAAARFYGALLGWDIETTHSPVGDYWICRADGHEVAGMMAPPPEEADQPPMWTVFFQVHDVDDMVTRWQDAGGTVLEPPFDIPDARIAVVADPTGAMCCLVSGMEPEGSWYAQEPGRACWVELLTRDTDAAEAFYRTVFGWKADTQGSDGGYTVFALDGDEVAGMLPMPAEVPAEAPNYWAVYFAVADCAAVEARAVELGGAVLHSATEVEGWRFAVLEDPQGATFSVLEPAA